jgi:hypothetical protein
MRPLRPAREVLADWLDELSGRLGRSRETIRDQGLSGYDFSPCAAVEVRRSDGMTIRFGSAFAIVRPVNGAAVVLSEHSGYIEFDLDENDLVAEIVETVYRGG